MTRSPTKLAPIQIPTTRITAKAKGHNKRRVRAKSHTIVLASVIAMVKAMTIQGGTSAT